MKLNPKIRNSTFAADLDGDVLWFPVHKSGDDGHEFICLSSWGADEQHARQNAAMYQAEIPTWLAANPVVRYEPLKIIAVRQS